MALKSKFAKKAGKFKANKIFTDRTEPRTVFADSIEEIVAAPENQWGQIVNFYGKGGIGKTCLLKEIVANSERTVYSRYPRFRFHNILISLEAYDYANPINVLTSLRGHIEGDGSLFDYALMQYYAKARISMEEIMQKNSFLSPSVIGIINEAIGICTASASIPQMLLEKGLALINDLHFRTKYREEIEEIADLNEFEIFERLPYYLGLCINHCVSCGVFHVLFLDSYESLYARTAGAVSSVDGSDWIRELFLSCSRTLFVIASRDRLDWEKQDEEWEQYLNRHLLTNLSDEDCRWFLEQVPVLDASGGPNTDAMNEIIRHAGGVPLYLDLCVDLYENSVNTGEPVDFHNFNGSATIIDRYMRHLKEKDQYAVSVLSTLRSFDTDFALRLLQKQNLIYHGLEIMALLEKSVFLALSERDNLYKVDESVRSHIYEQMQPKWRIALLENTLDVILEHRHGRLYPYLAAVLDTVFQCPEYIETIQDKLYEAVEYFSSIGYWNELRSVLSPYVTCDHTGLKSMAVFTELMWLRRTGNLAEAESFARAHPIRQKDMGVWYYMYCFFRTHVLHLLGNYDQCIVRYRELLYEMDLIKNTIPTHIYNTIAIKYTDLLFLKGHFQESMEWTERLLGDSGTNLPDVIELLRIKGHIFRFQKKYREAELIYDSALNLVLNHGLRALEGKLYTNLAEATCMTDPEKAMAWYEKAIDKNIAMNNEIEVGKAYVAASVAMTTAGGFQEAERMARTALVTAEMTGYQSGKVFALLAQAYAQKQADRPDEMVATVAQAKTLVEKIGVYHFLLPKEVSA